MVVIDMYEYVVMDECRNMDSLLETEKIRNIIKNF